MRCPVPRCFLLLSCCALCVRVRVRVVLCFVSLCVYVSTDLDCGGFYQSNTQGALDSGAITVDQIDRAVTRTFTSLVRLGWFDPPEQQVHTNTEKQNRNNEKGTTNKTEQTRDRTEQNRTETTHERNNTERTTKQKKRKAKPSEPNRTATERVLHIACLCAHVFLFLFLLPLLCVSRSRFCCRSIVVMVSLISIMLLPKP